MAVNFPSKFDYCVLSKDGASTKIVKVLYKSNSDATAVTKFNSDMLQPITGLSISVASGKIKISGSISKVDAALKAYVYATVYQGTSASIVLTSHYSITPNELLGTFSSTITAKDSTVANAKVTAFVRLTGYTDSPQSSVNTSGWEVETTTTTTNA